MKVVTYHILLEQPLLATQLLGDPNSSVSLPYVPGSLVRGMLVHRYLEREQLPDTGDVFAHAECRRLFFDGAVRYLNAYPLVEGGYRAVPTPLALLKRKKDELDKDRQELDLYNSSHADAGNEERRDFEDEDSAQIVDIPFCHIDSDEEIRLYRLNPRRVAVHVLRDRTKGRATREKGAVFQYEALAEDQWFGGAILVDNDNDAALIEALLKQRDVAWLGRSRSANYGRVKIKDVKVLDTWREIGGAIASAGNTITLNLLSDTLLRNNTGQHIAALDDATLSAYLGVQVRIVEQRTTTQPTNVGGYNRTWRLPLPQAPALKAGSVVVFTTTGAFDAQRMAELERHGIGERCVDGFGRVAFNWQMELHMQAKAGKLFNPTVALQPTLSTVAQRTAQHMARRLLEQRIDEAIQMYLQDHVRKDLGKMPANSQLGRVRVPVRQTLNAAEIDMQRLRSNLDQFKDVSRRQFQNARFDGASLWEWLNTLVAEPPTNLDQADIWQKLRITNSSLPTIGGQKAALDQDMTYRTGLRLIEAVFVALSRQSRREQEEAQV
jgi:CRISPR-associated protein Csx10